MPTHFTGRVFMALLVLGVATICILPPQTMFQPGLTLRERTMIKPGIDIAGGVSLVYKIKAPPGGMPAGVNLAEQTMEALKKRVDPDGVRNLVWRPIGNDEIEIQMPSQPHAEDAPKKREAYAEAQAKLSATNVLQSEVLRAIAMPAGAERDARLAKLAQDDPDRLKLFKTLADESDQVAAAQAAADKPGATTAQRTAAAKVLDEVGQKLDEGKRNIEKDNLTPDQLEPILDGVKTDPAKFQPMLDSLEKAAANFPSRLAAMKEYETRYADYVSVRASLDDSADLKALLRGSGVLEFHIVAFDTADPTFQMMMDRMKPGGKGPGPQPGDEKYRWFLVDKSSDIDQPGSPPRSTEWNDKHYLLCLITPDASMTKSQNWALESASPGRDMMGVRVVDFQFDTPGGHLFSAMTTKWQPADNRKYDLAVVLDDKIVSAPGIEGPITGGSGFINGGSSGFSDKDFDYLLNTLSAGSLPAQLEDEPISERRVGPSVGQDNLNKGLSACAFGLVVVGVFLIAYYHLAGVVAFSAVVMNVWIILGILAAFGATFTLPSIAAIVLSVGTAVDANVLIFERLREEQHRGMNLRMALRNSYDRAFSAIIDSNMTSVITSVFLYANGSEEVKGFGLTLIIGIVASLFTALYVTKTIFGILIDKFGVKHLGSLPLSFPKWDRLLRPNIDWMGLAWIFYSFSVVGITAGLILFGVYTYKGQMMDIEFASGTSVEVDLKQPMSIEDVRALIDKADPASLPAPSVVSVGTDRTDYEIVTPSSNTANVRQAILKTMADVIKTQLPSTFAGLTDKSAADAMADDLAKSAPGANNATGKVLFPIPADISQWPAGKAPDAASDMPGGVAVHLVNISPPLSPSQIKGRIDQLRLQVAGHEQINSLEVVGPSAGVDAPTTEAWVLASNPVLVYSTEHAADWTTDLANPVWNLVKESVNHEATLKRVSSFNPSVAGDTRRAAGLALTLSILVIMAYIWVRFGNLKYGTATVIALLHDTVFTLAALGFAHLLSNSPVALVLQLEPFRINLTVVAGILTIMGYSMIDTIVVFDRIRENRGKYGHLSRTVINDAINQTLSRTLLTAGTTTMTVAFMYFMGGSGIHGFTFVLLIGILVGTYSSVAIAAPILLVGKDVYRGKEEMAKREEWVEEEVRK